MPIKKNIFINDITKFPNYHVQHQNMIKLHTIAGNLQHKILKKACKISTSKAGHAIFGGKFLWGNEQKPIHAVTGVINK